MKARVSRPPPAASRKARVESSLAQAALDAMPAHTAILDASGIIVKVNASWRRFARENGARHRRAYLGWNYLAVCRTSAERDPAVESTCEKLGNLLAGRRREVTFEYSCSSPERERWFAARVSRFTCRGKAYFVAAHTDITARKLAEQARVRSEELLRKVLDTLPVGVWIMDAAGTIVYGNDAGQTIWAGARYVGPREFAEYRGWRLDSGERIEADAWAAARAISRGETTLGELVRIQCFDGTFKVILNSAMPMLDENGHICGAIIVNQDVTEAKKKEVALADREAQWRQLFSILPVGVAILDESSAVRDSNPALSRILQLPPSGLAIGAHRARTYLHADRTPLRPAEFPSTIAIRERRSVHDVEILVVTEEGEEVWTNVSAAPLLTDGSRAVVVTADITRRKRAESALISAQAALNEANRNLRRALEHEQVLARTDALTGVGNRRQFFDVAAHAIAAARRHHRPLSLILLDIDHFKEVNDLLGHAQGDAVLSEVAHAIARVLRETDFLARYGGEEFVVLLPESEQAGAMVTAERIRAEIAALPQATLDCRVTVSAGVAQYLDRDESLGGLLRRADQALYAAKQAGRNRCELAAAEAAPP